MSCPKKYVDDKRYKRLFYLTSEEWSTMNIETKYKMWNRGLTYGSENPLLKLNINSRELEIQYNAHMSELNQRTELERQLDELEKDKENLQEEVDILFDENIDLLLRYNKKIKKIAQLKQQLTQSESEDCNKLKERITTLEADLAKQKQIGDRIIATLEAEIAELTSSNRKFKEFMVQQVTELCDDFAAKLRREINITIETSTFNRKLNHLMNQLTV